jgi:hypothetical protein
MWRGEILCIRLEWDGVLYVDEWPSCREPLRLSPSSMICERNIALSFGGSGYTRVSRDSKRSLGERRCLAVAPGHQPPILQRKGVAKIFKFGYGILDPS